MLLSLEEINHLLKDVHKRNPFLHLLGINFTNIQHGGATLSMPIIEGKHTNIYGVGHGGALATLADTAMGVASSTLGVKVMTLDMNLNYIKSAQAGTIVYAFAKVLHQGKSTLVVEAEVRDDSEKLLVKARGTFFVVGEFQAEKNHA